MEKYGIIKHPIVTEHAVNSSEECNIYVFNVDLGANKVQIKESIEQIYDVKVLSVNTAVMRGKPRMYRRKYRSKLSNWKKAYVKLRGHDYIDLI